MKFLSKENISNKKVILRCDLNVPMKDGKVLDTERIDKSLRTINYLLERNCSIIILSHLGRIKTKEDYENNSLREVSKILSAKLNKDVKFLENPVGKDVIVACKNIQPKEVILLENTRFCDYPEKLESTNDLGLASYFASLGDVFVIDAFASLHRAHASVCGISKYKDTYLGLLVEEELNNLSKVCSNIAHPFTVFMGGAKVDDKLQYIKALVNECDYMILGGALANSFLFALGFDTFDSVVTSDEITLEEIRNLYKENKTKFVLPVDFIIDNNMILDAGDKTLNKYKKYLDISKTIFINGTCGKFEEEKYSKGTQELFEYLKNIDAIKVAGGGDTLNAINKFNAKDNFTFLSSGGGASLEYVSFHKLEALDFIENN